MELPRGDKLVKGDARSTATACAIARRLRRSKSPGLKSLVQLGGLEPPTSCSTDRRSNQLSYNCILTREPPKEGSRMGRKLGATPRFGKAAEHRIMVVSSGHLVHLPRSSARPSPEMVRGRT